MNPTQSLLQLPEFAQTASEKRTNPGVIVLTHQGQLLYMNREAVDFCAEMNQACLGQVTRGVLPTEVISLCRNIAELMLVITDVKDWESLHIRRMCEFSTHLVLLRGFGVPGPGDVDQARIIIMLDRIAPREPVAISQAYARFGLTPRGRAVVRFLAQGHTSKEIAQRLGITEQTIKEHIQRLMKKTKTRTRTGLLARLLLKGDSVGVIASVLLSFC
jgi:DNA-binding CsgD family transcriptional regulator